MKHVKEFESFIGEALTSKKPNEVETIDLDMAWDDSDPKEVKAVKAAWKKFNIKVKSSSSSGPMQGGTYEVTGKKKDILAYLQSEFYDMDEETIKEFYPELLEGNSEDDYVMPMNEGAFHVALYKARNEGAKEFEFKGKMYPVKEKKVDESAVNEDWGSSDQATMNRAIHKDMGNPSRFPSPFDDKLRSAAADAVDFWWDEWPEYKRDREGLIDDAIRAYYRAYFPKEFAGFTKMFSESAVNEGALSKSEANHLAHKMLNYAVDNGMIPASKKTKEHVDSLTDSLFNAKLDLKKDPRGAAHKILNGLVDRGLIPVSKKTEDHISTLADKLKNVELNEAMVQVAGHNKPSGARVLATVIIDHLEDQNFLKLDNTRLKNQLLMDLTELIMNSTF